VNNQEIPSLIASTHIASRLCVGATLLLTAVVNHTIAVALFQLILSLFVLQHYKEGRQRILRALALLRWLVIPIIILHALFTPGALIMAGMAWPVSVEGLQAGFWFSLHLVVIFFAAMLFSQLLTQSEWVNSSLKFPLIGQALLPYHLLMNRCWQRIRSMLGDEYAVWRKEKHRVRTLLPHLSGMPVRTLTLSREIAGEIWNDWDQQVIELMEEKSRPNISIMRTLAALSLVLLMWVITFYGGI